MEGKHVDGRSLAGAVWTAVLAPVVSVLPVIAARTGGQGGWLAPLVALPVLLLLIKSWGALGRSASAWRSIHLIYIMWAVLLGAARLRLSGQRLQYTAQREGELWLALLALGGGALWLAWGRRAAFLRAAAVFGRVLTLALTAVLVLTLPQIRAEHLLPLWTGDVLPVLRSAAPVLGVLCYGVYSAFMWRGELGGTKGAVGGCFLLTAFLLSVLGNLGVELTAALEEPFLMLSRRVGVEGAFQRVESLVSALWLLGDLSLLGLLLWACRSLLPEKNGRWAAVGGALLMLALAGTLFRDAIRAQWFEYAAAPAGNLVLGGVVPGAAAWREKRKGISCGVKADQREDVGRETGE